MAANYNKGIVAGTLIRDFELKPSANGGKPYATNSVVINNKWTDKNTKEKKEKSTYINFTLFGTTAESAVKYVGKGCQVILEYEMSNMKEKVLQKDGTEKDLTRLIVDVLNITYITYKDKTATAPKEQPEPKDEVPF